MRRLPVAFRPEALEDLSDIFRFVFRASRDIKTAQDFVLRIKARCDAIGNAPAADALAMIWNPACARRRSSTAR